MACSSAVSSRRAASQTTSRLQTPVSACAAHALQLTSAARRMACCPARKTTAARAKEPPASAPREDAAARAAEYVCSRAPTAAVRLSAAACSPAELTAPCKCIKARTVTTVPLCSLYGRCLASNVPSGRQAMLWFVAECQQGYLTSARVCSGSARPMHGGATAHACSTALRIHCGGQFRQERG